MFSEGIQAIHDVIKRAVGRGTLIQTIAQSLIPLELQEAVKVAGIERGRAQLGGALAGVAQLRVLRGGRLRAKGVEGAGLVRVLQGEIDPVEQLGRLVNGGSARLDG